MSGRREADFCTIGAVQNGMGMSDPLACTSFPRVSESGLGWRVGRGGGVHPARGIAGL